MRPVTEVSNLINCLTNSEDARQDLWVHYLSGTPIEALSSRLKEIQIEYSDDTELRKAVWQLLRHPISEELSNFLQENFTDYERSIICFMALGLDLSKIADIKGISEVRIRQSIAAIRYNSCWSEFEKLHKVSKNQRVE